MYCRLAEDEGGGRRCCGGGCVHAELCIQNPRLYLLQCFLSIRAMLQCVNQGQHASSPKPSSAQLGGQGGMKVEEDEARGCDQQVGLC
jgi:hypothetical protein